jgi:TonB family protein
LSRRKLRAGRQRLAGSTRIEADGNNPSPPPAPPEPPRSLHHPRRRLYEEPDPEFVPHMLAQLEDELARSRKREAFWISVVIHILFVLLIIFSPELLPRWAQPHLLRAQDLTRSQEPTFLALPPDTQKPPVKVHTDKLSDKNRIAQTTHPQIDRKTLEALREQGNRMPPSPPEAAPPMPEPAGVPQPQPPAPPANSRSEISTLQPPRVPKEQPQAQPSENPFRMPSSAGSLIAEAARSTRPRFPRGGAGGSGYGMGSLDRNASLGPFDILSDTQGVDFGPYLARALESIKNNWYNLIPEEARPPMLKHGKVAIRFLITPSGKVTGLYVEGPSGDIPLDRAAYGGITASDPFSPLPSQFHGPYLALRITFFYNPTTQEMEELQQ